jgi:lysophospholipase L1-like esterase
MKKKFFIKMLLPLGLLVVACMPLEKKHIKVYLIGDSTIANKEVKAYPETGWGMPFTYFFDSTVTVDNRAKNGRSTKSFRAEGLWQPVLANLQTGDYVMIQFGHNDEVPTKAVFTPEDEFKNNLTQYIAETKSKGANPILITPVARRKFDSTGKIMGTHDVYSAIVRAVAKQTATPLIDLDLKSQELLQQYGPEASTYLFNYLAPGEHPNYPEGKKDDTHFSELGARKMAQIVLSEIKSLNLELASRIVKPIIKK